MRNATRFELTSGTLIETELPVIPEATVVSAAPSTLMKTSTPPVAPAPRIHETVVVKVALGAEYGPGESSVRPGADTENVAPVPAIGSAAPLEFLHVARTAYDPAASVEGTDQT